MKGNIMDTKSCISFESFLAKIQDYQALETFVYTYADSHVDNVSRMMSVYIILKFKLSLIQMPTFLENESRQDPVLVPLWAEYDTFLKIARMVVNALSGFINATYLDSLSWLLRAKREEATWKEHLLLETDLINEQSKLQSLGFEQLIFTYGKACIKVNETIMILYHKFIHWIHYRFWMRRHTRKHAVQPIVHEDYMKRRC